MGKSLLLFIIFLLNDIRAEDVNPSAPTATTLGNFFRQARSEYFGGRFGADGSSVTSGAIGIRSEPEHRDAAYYESRCITCDPNKSPVTDRGWRQKTRYDMNDDAEERRYRDRYDDYFERTRGSSYDYERPRGGSSYDYDRARGPAYDYDRSRPSSQEYDRYDRYDPYGRTDPLRPMLYSDRYDMQSSRDRYYDMRYDRNYDRYPERGNGYDNLNQKYPAYGNRYDPYNSPRRPTDDPYMSMSRYDYYNRNYMKYDQYDPYDGIYYRKPYDERYDRYDRFERYPTRGGADSRGYFSSGTWGPGYDRGYASAWNYAGGSRDGWREPGRERDPGFSSSDNWKDLNRDRDAGHYRPRDYFHDSTAPPGGSRGTSYLYDRPESSTKPDSTERDKPTSSPQTQDNKVYKD